MNSLPLVITGMGAITSVGRSVTAACAAILAGISRPRRVAWLKVLDEERQELVPLVAHPLKGYTEGFVGEGRWMRLARGAVMDLLSASGIPDASETHFWKKTGLLVVSSYPEGPLAQNSEQPVRGSGTAELRAARLRHVLRLPIDERHLDAMRLGQAGMAAALEQAARELSRFELERILIVAADSFLDPSVLESLGTSRRLKTEDNPCGLMPGEAGACFLLELEASVRRRRATALAAVSGFATGREEHHLTTRGQNTGQGLSACIRKVLESNPMDLPFSGDIYSDLNGENWRAREWGSARIRLADLMGEPAVHLPCASIGDTGAASGALGMCLAVHSMRQGRTRKTLALVVSSSERGEVGCIALNSVKA